MAVKRKATSDIAEEVDDFEADARLMRKMKKGKLSQKELKSIMWTNSTIQKILSSLIYWILFNVKVFSNEDHLCFGEKAVFLLIVFVICFNFSNKFCYFFIIDFYGIVAIQIALLLLLFRLFSSIFFYLAEKKMATSSPKTPMQSLQRAAANASRSPSTPSISGSTTNEDVSNCWN